MATSNPAQIYTSLTDAAQAPRRAPRRHRRAAQLGLGDDPPSACPNDRAGRRNIAGRHALGELPTRLPVAGASALPAVPAAFPGWARRRPRGGPAGLLRRDREPAPSPSLSCPPRTAAAEELVRLCQGALRRA